MDIVCRTPERSDLPALLEIERQSTPRLQYLGDVVDEFFDPAQGEMILAEEHGCPVGFAHLSRQYDGSAWLECLRVLPECQQRGVGAQIWERVMELCEQWKSPALRMYTGARNYASRVLAERRGLTLALTAMEGVLLRGDVRDMGLPLPEPTHFGASLDAYAQGNGGYLCLNRTFYPMGPELYQGLARAGMIYRSGQSCLVLGARFQLRKGLNIALMGGDPDICARWAIGAMRETMSPRLVCMLPESRTDLRECLEKYGMQFPDSRIILMERRF